MRNRNQRGRLLHSEEHGARLCVPILRAQAPHRRPRIHARQRSRSSHYYLYLCDDVLEPHKADDSIRQIIYWKQHEIP